ncbi:MAG TPA: isoprenyl transferase [Candidatus Aphodoplasma excrementigallinarum]|uniref:Isoprenyl transferase n=1 Tax=Candidatus Aphodoplasma excrementigallinarum TaxID=2840673 RepID=A0A9D1NGN7_9FIRM|nr:isoprenyl transferase [Candidatus Aphodoplasma excrementigallinarum]
MALFRKAKKEYDKALLPKHVAIIMDGNGRWAKKRSLPRIMGHRAGADALRRVSRFAGHMGIEYITVYAFSTENWKRSDEEVSGLMSLLLDYLKNAEKELGGDEVRIRVIGDPARFSDEIQQQIKRVEAVTKDNKAVTVTLALNYGGRDELVHAVKAIAKEVQDGKTDPDSIDEKTVSRHLYTYDMPDPDLVIRTSGELRLSNYLLWQTSYSELYFTDTLWPDFDEKEFTKAIDAYLSRSRRFGGR